MGKAFEMRCEKGSKWAAEVKAILEERGHSVVPMGAEHIAPKVQQALTRMDDPDPTAMFVRFLPDCFLVHGTREDAYFIDAKCGSSIEKEAYSAYMLLANSGLNVYVMIKYGGNIYCVSVDELPFKDSQEHVQQYPNPHPVDEDGWIAPRLRPDARAWAKSHPNASGTRYKEIDFSRLHEWEGGVK